MLKFLKKMGQIIINGIPKKGNSLKIVNNKVLLDGVDITPKHDKAINIEINGNVNEVNVGACNIINVKGDIGYLEATTGDVIISGDVGEQVSTTTGSVTCDNVNGHVQTNSGDVVISGKVGGAITSVSGNLIID
jgi:hypothetical protein